MRTRKDYNVVDQVKYREIGRTSKEITRSVIAWPWHDRDEKKKTKKRKKSHGSYGGDIKEHSTPTDRSSLNSNRRSRRESASEVDRSMESFEPPIDRHRFRNSNG